MTAAPTDVLRMCNFCVLPGRPVIAMCVHEHRIEGYVCEKRHARKLANGLINCGICASRVPPENRHICPIREVIPA